MIGDIKHIFVIQSLFEHDEKTGADLYNDVVSRGIDRQAIKGKMTHKFFNVNSKDQLIDYLNYIAANAVLMRDGILIHLEMHGSKDRTGLILNDRSLITWSELVSSFRQINMSSLDHLYVSLASCYGRDLYKGVEPELKSPYSAYISASKEVMPDEIIENFGDLFDALIICGNLIEAYLSATKDGTSFYYKDSKTTFDDLMALTKYSITHDADYREEIIGGALFKDALAKGIASQEDLNLLMQRAYDDIYKRHKQAFEFDDEG